MRLMSIILALAASALAMPADAAQTAPACVDMLAIAQTHSTTRPIEPVDLLRLRDIGYMHLAQGQRFLSVSPDRKHLAFVMHRADPASDRYCAALFVLNIATKQVRMLDSADDLLMDPVAIRGVEVDYGLPRTLLPQWSADGRRIAYLRKIDGRAQIIAISFATGTARQATHTPVGVDHFAWAADGTSLVYSDRPARLAAMRAIAEEREPGYLFDDRILPYTGTAPALKMPLPAVAHRVGADGRASDSLSLQDERRLETMRSPAGDQSVMTSASSWTLERRQPVPGSYASPTELVATDPKGQRYQCEHANCRGTLYFNIEGMWDTDRPGEFTYLKREGWGGSQYGLYLWRAGAAPRRLLLTNDLILGCETLGSRLLCARETARRPRHLIIVDLRGRAGITELFDPNPNFLALAASDAQRLHWRNAQGQESYGDLVLPPDRKPGEKLPLVIVQYISRGFLRGGTGDEYPVQAFARNGFAVLSFHKPSALFAAQGNDGKMVSILRRLNQDWEDRRNILSSLTTGIDLLRARGDIDPDRIGISGVSDGSTTVQFGLINQPGLFKAASVGSCCVDPTAMMIYGGTALARERADWGYPPPFGPGSEKWRPLALSRNAPSVMAPLLMHLADNEFLIAMETIAAYKKNERPIEVRILPQEHHLKVGPRHRLAVYCRNLRWFGFWLDQPIHGSSCPTVEDDHDRWSAMKKAWKETGKDRPSTQ